jgi:hypothetical protein
MTALDYAGSAATASSFERGSIPRSQRDQVLRTRGPAGSATDGDSTPSWPSESHRRLDDAFRQYLSERSATRLDVEEVAALVGGATRLRRSALSLRSLATMAESEHRLESCARNLNGELLALQSWYITLGYALANGRPIPPPHVRDRDGHGQLLACIRGATRGREPTMLRAAALLLWASQYLDDLWGSRNTSARTHRAWQPQ